MDIQAIFRVSAARFQTRYRNRRTVGGKNRPGRGFFTKLSENLFFQFKIFRDSFDNQLSVLYGPPQVSQLLDGLSTLIPLYPVYAESTAIWVPRMPVPITATRFSGKDSLILEISL
jgi:hypothetical protein